MNRNPWTLLIALISVVPVQAQDCFVDRKPDPTLKLFEKTMGYRLNVAEDGTDFKADEKTGFALLSMFLPPVFRNMDTLEYLERVPDGYALEGGAVGEYFARRMIYSSRYLKGYIHLTEGSMTIKNGRLTGEFYATAVHEMSHALDYLHGRVSLTDEWTGSSTWEESPKEKTLTATSKNFVSDYARSHPLEDFAESVAAFVLDPDLLSKNAPDKFEFISKRFFDGKKYDTATLRAQYQKQLDSMPESERADQIRKWRLNDYYACSILPRP